MVSKRTKNFQVKVYRDKGIENLDKYLYVKKNADIKIHPWLKKVGDTKTEDIYIYKGNFQKDCLQFAESFACGVKGYAGKTSQYIEKETGRVFGFNHANKIANSKNAIKNEKASPLEGEAYAIVARPKSEKEIDSETYPYYIAYVLYREGNATVTIEVFGALNENNEAGEEVCFNIYYTDIPIESFHKIWSPFYEHVDPVTVVLMPRYKDF